jgi:hypothetical protein
MSQAFLAANAETGTSAPKGITNEMIPSRLWFHQDRSGRVTRQLGS